MDQDDARIGSNSPCHIEPRSPARQAEKSAESSVCDGPKKMRTTPRQAIQMRGSAQSCRLFARDKVSTDAIA